VERIEEFSRGGEKFMSIDFSGFRHVEEFAALIESAKPVISKYAPGTLNTITNIENVRFDTAVKDVIVDYLNHNKPYVKIATVTGMDGVKKMMANALIKLSGRKNVFFAFTREQAIEMALQNNTAD